MAIIKSLDPVSYTHLDVYKRQEQRIKCEQQNIKNDINFKEIKEQNIQFQQSISVKFDELKNDIQERNKRFENTNEIIRTSRCV